jgi:hypothetical protein
MKNGEAEEVWLLVMVDGGNSKSDPTLRPELMPQRKFAFSKIIVFNPMTKLSLSAPSERKG